MTEGVIWIFYVGFCEVHFCARNSRIAMFEIPSSVGKVQLSILLGDR